MRRRVWEVTGSAVFALPDEEFLRLGKGGDPGPIIGFPIEDVFRAEFTVEETADKQFSEGIWDWSQVTPYVTVPPGGGHRGRR